MSKDKKPEWKPRPKEAPKRHYPEGPDAWRVEKGEYEETHPAFGTILVLHTQGDPGVMFGSRVRSPGAYVTLEIRTAKKMVRFGEEHAFGWDTLLAVKMTHAQFVEMVGRPNTGTGIPCTLSERRTDDGRLEWYPAIEEHQGDTEVEIAIETLRRKGAELANAHRKAVDDVLAALKPKLSNKLFEEVQGKLLDHASDLKSSLPFYAKQVDEVVERAASVLRTEVDAAQAVMERKLGALMVDNAVHDALRRAEERGDPAPHLLGKQPCPHCGDTGVVTTPTEGGGRRFKRCECALGAVAEEVGAVAQANGDEQFIKREG